MNSLGGHITFQIFAGSRGNLRFGESIVLRTPCGKVGVIDCCKGDRVHPAAYLDVNRVDELDFVLITHPHKDHTNGFAELLADREVRERFKYYGSRLRPRGPLETKEDVLKFLEANASEIIGCLSSPTEEKENILNYEIELWNLFGDQTKRWNIFHAEQTISRSYQDGFMIQAMSPSRELCSDLMAQQAEHFREIAEWVNQPDNGKMTVGLNEEIHDGKSELFRVKANLLSVCLSVRWGEFRGLLLADAEPDNLKQAFAIDPDWFRGVTFVKVAHHGGSGANPVFAEGLKLFDYLKRHRSPGTPLIAAVTHYNTTLPDRGILDEIAGCCDAVYLATEPPVRERFSPDYMQMEECSVLGRDAASKQEWKTRSVLRPEDKREGWFSLKFQSDGRLLNDPVLDGAILWNPT